MVIVIVGAPAAIGRALASELDWPYVDATHVRPIVARAVNRREGAVVGCSSLPVRDREALHADLRAVRFVYLQADGAFAAFSSAVGLTSGVPAAEAIGQIRREFGV